MEIDLSFAQLARLFQFAPNRVLPAVLPVILLAVVAEMLAILLRRGRYPWGGSLVSLAIAVGHALAQAATNGIILGVIAAGVYEFRLTTIDVSFEHWPALVALFVLADFSFYWQHRLSHRIRLMWASHSVHHTVERMVLIAAVRLAWTPILSGIFLFYLPLIWIGFPPAWVFGTLSASLAFQFFIHTELVPRIGWLEWVINTPSAHRVHHASNPEYIDKNFGGVFLIWDRIFGTYEPERPEVPVVFGLVHKRSSATNPFIIAYGELWELARDVFRARNWRERFCRVFAPPGWEP